MPDFRLEPITCLLPQPRWGGGGGGVKKVVNVKAPPESPNPLPCYIIILIINLYLYTKSYHFYMVFLGVVSKIILKYSKKLLDYVPMK